MKLSKSIFIPIVLFSTCLTSCSYEISSKEAILYLLQAEDKLESVTKICYEESLYIDDELTRSAKQSIDADNNYFSFERNEINNNEGVIAHTKSIYIAFVKNQTIYHCHANYINNVLDNSYIIEQSLYEDEYFFYTSLYNITDALNLVLDGYEESQCKFIKDPMNNILQVEYKDDSLRGVVKYKNYLISNISYFYGNEKDIANISYSVEYDYHTDIFNV